MLSNQYTRYPYNTRSDPHNSPPGRRENLTRVRERLVYAGGILKQIHTPRTLTDPNLLTGGKGHQDRKVGRGMNTTEPVTVTYSGREKPCGSPTKVHSRKGEGPQSLNPSSLAHLPPPRRWLQTRGTTTNHDPAYNPNTYLVFPNTDVGPRSGRPPRCRPIKPHGSSPGDRQRTSGTSNPPKPDTH